ncbi:ATP/GTP-binding protein OS=Streptomyces tendae OX=1932 GN=GUR47_38355 PE=4 SV=1 [Streptomyces tendae]
MPARHARTAAAPVPVTASVPAPGGMAAQHATDITLDDELKALTLLTTAGMETYAPACAQLARQARRLLNELETMAADLATTHNVSGKRTTRALSVLMESVGELILYAERMARAALAAAETAEAEETAMARDYRPTQDATVDAGLAAPSARIHNEN